MNACQNPVKHRRNLVMNVDVIRHKTKIYYIRKIILLMRTTQIGDIICVFNLNENCFDEIIDEIKDDDSNCPNDEVNLFGKLIKYVEDVKDKNHIMINSIYYFGRVVNQLTKIKDLSLRLFKTEFKKEYKGLEPNNDIVCKTVEESFCVGVQDCVINEDGHLIIKVVICIK